MEKFRRSFHGNMDNNEIVRSNSINMKIDKTINKKTHVDNEYSIPNTAVCSCLSIT